MQRYSAGLGRGLFLLISLAAWGAVPCSGQYTNRYPHLTGGGHHIYFEGYEMPVLGTGPIDPVATPDGTALIFSAKGWLWRYDLRTGAADQITEGGDSDFRPGLSPDGGRVAFVRDNSRTTKIVLKDLRSGEEKTLVESGKIDLDPAFSPDGQTVYYSSSEEGDLDIWKIEIASGHKTRLTTDPGLELRPLPLPDGRGLIFVAKARGSRASNDRICLLEFNGGEHRVLRSGAIISQMRPALAPDGNAVLVNWPTEDVSQRYQLSVLDLQQPDLWMSLTYDRVLPLTPAWSPDRKTIYFVEADANQDFVLKAIPAVGGTVRELRIERWNWRGPMGRVIVRTQMDGEPGPLPARLSVTDRSGHPLFPVPSNPRFDSHSGASYFHSPGTVEIEAPAGSVRVVATHGFVAAAETASGVVPADGLVAIDLSLKRLWNPQSAGWYSGDNHFHLNYGGTYPLTPDHLVPMMRAEDLDAAVPMTANLHTRIMDAEWIGWKRDHPPVIRFGQEVRSHFLGHLGLVNLRDWYWPWFYGPGYPDFGRDAQFNAEVLKHGRAQSALNTYVHPVTAKNPFDEKSLASPPVNLVPDAMLGLVDSLEIACLYISEIGTSELWYRLLNVGLPIVPTGGSDAFPNFYRNMIFGSARSYVHIDGPFRFENYFDALRRGRSFATTGPLLDFRIEGSMPGDVLKRGGTNASWSLDVYSPTPVEKVEIVVNGQIVLSEPGLSEAGKKSYRGQIRLPSNGWVAARVHGDNHDWPVMHTRSFAHTAPIWIGAIGSRDAASAKAAAQDLLRVLEAAEKRVDQSYEGVSIPELKSEFREARTRLEKLKAE